MESAVVGLARNPVQGTRLLCTAGHLPLTAPGTGVTA